MRCPGCQHENREGRRFCSECGASLAFLCAACGFSNEPGEKFCGGCGQPLLSSAQQSTPKSVSPVAYTPKHLAEKILTSKVALEGERKQVTVLFADLKGSMELLADRDPEEARKLLDPVLERMMEAVHRYEGTVNQVMGDGIMALFGAPVAHEDHAVRACYAALADAGGRPALRGRASAAGRESRCRSGSASTPARSSCARSAATCAWTTRPWARPPTWPRGWSSSRRPARIRLTAETLALAEGLVQVARSARCRSRGSASRSRCSSWSAPAPARTRLQAAAARGLTRFVGRDRGAGRSSGTPRPGGRRATARWSPWSGEPGVGKSRLVWEFTHSHRTHGWLIVRAELGLVRQGHRLPSGDRPAPRLLRDREPRRPATDPGEGRRARS